MGGFRDLDEIRGLYHDLLAFTESRLLNVESLALQLENRLEDLRSLLDKRPKNENSRKSLLTGNLTIEDEDYNVNEDFRQGAIELADGLDLDELEAARLFLTAQNDVEILDRSPLQKSILQFHERRQFLLECIRIILQKATDEEGDQGTVEFFRTVMIAMLDSRGTKGSQRYSQRCLVAMRDVQSWLQTVTDHIQNASVLGKVAQGGFAEVIEFQRTSLARQHELLAEILSHVVSANEAKPEDFHNFLRPVKAADRYDSITLHYIPPLLSFIARFGHPDGGETFETAKSFHEVIMINKDPSPWNLHYLHAATTVWWLAEFSAWFLDMPNDPAIASLNLEEESRKRSDLFFNALQNGAFDLLLSISFEVKRGDWIDPVRATLRRWLLQHKNRVPEMSRDKTPFGESFQILLMERLEIFVDRIITNMPLLLRRLRTDEDEQRLLNMEKQQKALSLDLDPQQHSLDLEKFIVSISYIFEHRIDAAETFWEDPENTLFGFLQWISRRLSTPRACAVSELVLGLSEGQECADAAHKFLMEESSGFGGKRRTHSLSWDQILLETQYFVNKVRETPGVAQSSQYGKSRDRRDRAGPEPETDKMLESYLRLTASLCRNSLEARTWLLNHQTYRIVDLLLAIAGSTVPSALRACAFEAIAALLADKSREVGDAVWLALDQWISGGSAQGIVGRTGGPAGPQWKEDLIFENMRYGFEEPAAFIGLLQVLVAPYSFEDGLNDSLPFPEGLGSSHRSAGIIPYIDFALGRVFAQKTAEVQDGTQLRILRLACLEFVATCLSTFNEDLVVFSAQSKLEVDSAIRASSLEIYVRLHPFARVMEWLFNDRVQDALFATTHQDLDAVIEAADDSPLFLGLLRSVEVMNLIFDLQVTYLNLVRPIIKTNSVGRPNTVANVTIASFDDAILNNLQIVVDLSHYCGAGHAYLSMASINLLQRICSSRKVMVMPKHFPVTEERDRIVSVLDMNGESERISQTFNDSMQLDAREIEYGPESPGYAVKKSILNFLHKTLLASQDRPVVAHMLLGFVCKGRSIEIGSNSPFTKSVSLFHSVLDLVQQYPAGQADSFLQWMAELKQSAFEVLQQLWKSPLSSIYTMTELRSEGFLFDQMIKQTMLSTGTLFDERTMNDDDFYLDSSAVCLVSVLQQRAAFFDFVATEIRLVSSARSPTFMHQIVSSLLGETRLPDGEAVRHLSVLDLFDFVELDVPGPFRQPALTLLNFNNFDSCQKVERDVAGIYEIRKVEELILLQSNELRRAGQLANADREQAFQVESTHLLGYCVAESHRRRLVDIRLNLLKIWTNLVSTLVELGDLSQEKKAPFILQTLQYILPKLERFCLEDATQALEIARLAKTLLFNLEFQDSTLGKGKPGDMATDRLFQLFKISLCGVHSPTATLELRNVLYAICYRYLTGLSTDHSSTAFIQRHSIQTVKSSGERLIDVICDDAYAADNVSRVSALLTLDALVALGQREASNHILDSFSRLNFVNLLVDNVRHMPTEIVNTDAQDVSLLLSNFFAKLFLLQRIAQSRQGSSAVLNAGLFQAIRDSGLFSVDPDLGIAIDNPNALRKYYELLLAVVRIINTAVLSRAQHEQTISHAQKFLRENRSSIVAVLKKHANIGGSRTAETGDLEELVDNFVLLISLSRFLEFEDSSTLQRSKSKVFS